jgi:hypothetical protein
MIVEAIHDPKSDCIVLTGRAGDKIARRYVSVLDLELSVIPDYVMHYNMGLLRESLGLPWWEEVSFRLVRTTSSTEPPAPALS